MATCRDILLIARRSVYAANPLRSIDGKDSWKHSTNFFNDVNNKQSFGSIKKKAKNENTFLSHGYNDKTAEQKNVVHWTESLRKDKYVLSVRV